jgi:hypothetical protein
MSYPTPTLKQTAVILALAAALWVPMTLFIIFESEKFNPRQMAGLGALNMIIGVTILVWSFRTWIQKIR